MFPDESLSNMFENILEKRIFSSYLMNDRVDKHFLTSLYQHPFNLLVVFVVWFDQNYVVFFSDSEDISGFKFDRNSKWIQDGRRISSMFKKWFISSFRIACLWLQKNPLNLKILYCGRKITYIVLGLLCTEPVQSCEF